MEINIPVEVLSIKEKRKILQFLVNAKHHEFDHYLKLHSEEDEFINKIKNFNVKKSFPENSFIIYNCNIIYLQKDSLFKINPDILLKMKKEEYQTLVELLSNNKLL